MTKYEWHMTQIEWHKRQLRRCSLTDIVAYSFKKSRKKILKNMQSTNALFKLFKEAHESTKSN